jgi:pimeloyl-ACP methyl ester carboxylesterase
LNRAYIEIPEGQIHYRMEGKGQTLLLLHQATLSSLDFVKMIPYLSKNYRVIAMDMLGCGGSDPATHAYKIEEYAESVKSFLNALKIKSVNIVGHHTGAYLGIELAVKYPKLVNKLVLSGAASVRQTEDLNEAPKGLPYANYYEAFRPLEVNNSILQQISGKVEGLASKAPPEIKYEMYLENLQSGPRAEEAHMAFISYNPAPRLPLIKCPTLVLSGREDSFIAELDNVKNLIPGSVSYVIEGPKSGITISREMPQEFAEVVLGFLSGTNSRI